jgi:DNA-binding transcriptional ArsR family regulator
MNAAGPSFISTMIETELTTVLLALCDPVRLAIVRELDADGTRSCGSFDHLGVGRPTLSHHFKVLREAELIETHADGQRRLNTLRRDEIEARFPGLLDSVLAAYARGEAAAISAVQT